MATHCEPRLTTMRTVSPCIASLSAAGSCEITSPFSTVSLYSCVASPTRWKALSERSASSSDTFTTLGTVTP